MSKKKNSGVAPVLRESPEAGEGREVASPVKGPKLSMQEQIALRAKEIAGTYVEPPAPSESDG